MNGNDIVALILIIAALVCFIFETFRSGFSLLAAGLACMAGYFLVIGFETLKS